MLDLLDRLPYTYLMIFFGFTFVSIYGKDKDFSPSCEVELMVRRGTTWKTAPRQSLTVECPVKHCGETLNVTWCKLFNVGHCEQLNETQNVEIRQKYNSVQHKLILYLTFKHMSIHDNGLYRCDLKGYKYDLVSHTINVSVSDRHVGVEHSDNNGVEYRSSRDEDTLYWLPYFYICVSIALLVTILTALTHLYFHDWKRTLTYKPTNGQQMSTSMIPDLPKRSDPTTPILHDHFSVLSPLSLITNGNQALAKTTNESQVSVCEVYAEINHTQPTLPARKQHLATKQDKNTEYAVINVS